MLVICLDGYDWRSIKDIKWHHRFDYFGHLDTTRCTVLSNSYVLTNHPAKVIYHRWYVKDQSSGKDRILRHTDLEGPYLWDTLYKHRISQAWICFTLMNPIVKYPDSFVIGGYLCSEDHWSQFTFYDYDLDIDLDRISELRDIIHKKDKWTVKELKTWIDIELEVYECIKHKYDFVFLYLHQLDIANHIPDHLVKSKEIKEYIDKKMNLIALEEKTLLYSDHGKWERPGHHPEGIVATIGNSYKIKSIVEIYQWILYNLNIIDRIVGYPKPEDISLTKEQYKKMMKEKAENARKSSK